MRHKEKTRLYIKEISDYPFSPSQDQTHKILHVLKFKKGECIHIFNEEQGEFKAEIIEATRNKLLLQKKTLQTPPPNKTDNLWLCFATLKRDRANFIAEKASELGTSSLYPVLTDQSDQRALHLKSFERHLIEASEQSGRITPPKLMEIQKLEPFLENFPNDRRLFICAESGKAKAAHLAFQDEKKEKIAFLIGPAGGFSSQEFALFERYNFIQKIHLGPLILRAETAALSALSIWQALKGSWK